MSTAFAAEQLAAIERRDGRVLLSANAGSGKTTVLVERFARTVIEDEIAPGRILAITFTDKAAGELRSRIRARFAADGRDDDQRALESAWISTFHGFCARVLRAQAIPAGLDPGFVVLDEPLARELSDRAWDEALAGFLAGRPPRPGALDLAAAYGADRLATMIRSAYDELRSRGATRPGLPAPPPVAEPDLDALEDACAAALRALDGVSGATVERAVAALEAREAFKPGNVKALKGPECARYLEALAAVEQARHDRRGADAVALLDELLGRYADAYAAAKHARSALDFDDLELCVRDLFAAQPQIAAAYAERFDRVMVDEFQDTNRVQLALLEHLDRDNVFVVGDELQSIYGFRHADVSIFRERRAALQPAGAALTLATNWRSRPAILRAVDEGFGALHGAGHVPFAAGRAEHHAEPVVELLLTGREWDADHAPDVAGALPAAPARRQAEARLVAQRVAELVEGGVAQGDVVVLLRSATDMHLFERAIEEHGLSTLAAGGRGYWARQQVLDLCAYLAAIANPRDETALFGVLASPLAGLSSSGLALIAAAAKRGERWDAVAEALRGGDLGLPAADRERLETFGPWFAAERAAAPRLGLDELLERVVATTGYDLHVLGLPGGRRRLANVQKLMRLAAAFEARGGRDVRGLIDLATAEIEAESREPDAPVELGDEPAVRLMTIHAAKGLEFPVVVVADVGRQGRADVPDLLVDGGRVGVRVAVPGGDSVKALCWQELRDELVGRDAAEEHRVFHVAFTRARERLIVSGGGNLQEWKEPRPGGPPLLWVAPRLVPGLAQRLAAGEHEFTAGGVRVLVSTPDSGVLRPSPVRAATVAAEGTGRHPLPPSPEPVPDTDQQLSLFDQPERQRRQPAPSHAPAAAPASVSFSGLTSYAECPYRWYLQRVLRLPPADPGPEAAAEGRSPIDDAAIDPLVRGSIVHELLEGLDLRAPAVPGEEAIRAQAARHDVEELDAGQLADLRALVQAFVDSPLARRLQAADALRKEAGFTVATGEHDPLLTGVVDVLATEAGGALLVVDYKTNPVEDVDLPQYVEAAYGLQRDLYALAALRTGAPAVELAYLFLERPAEPVVTRFAPADTDRLQARVRAAARGLLAGEFPVTDRPHRAVCLKCPGRRGLCSWDAARQLREQPEAA